MRCKKLTCACFTLNRKSVYLKLTCEKQIIIKPVQSEHAIQRDTWLLQTLFRNRRCSLGTLWTVLSKSMYNISKRFSNNLQITGYLLHLIRSTIYIIIFTQVDNKRFNFIIKDRVYDTKLFLFLNANFQWIHFLYISIGLSPQLLMSYLCRH